MSQQSMLQIALKYHADGVAEAAGRAVVPLCRPIRGQARGCLDHPDCAKPGKRALVRWKPYQARLPAEDDVRQWWHQWPDAGVGAPTGRYHGIVVLDVDGDYALAAVQRQGALPPTLSALSGRPGGRHFYFRHPGGHIPSIVALLPGVDVRADGGLVVLPPSLHLTGNRYQWDPATAEHGLAPLPAWLLELIVAGAPDEHGQPRLDVAAVLNGVAQGERDVALFRLAAKLRAADVPEEWAIRLVGEAAAQCSPPFPERDARAKVASAYGRYAAGTIPNSQSLYTLGIGNDEEPTIVRAWEQPEPAPRRWVLPGLVPERSTAVWYGDAGVYKTYLAIYTACCIAAPLPWLGEATERRVVLFVDAELDADEFLTRAYMVARGLGLERPPEGLHYWKLETSLADPATFEQVLALIRTIGADFILLDSLSIATFGGELEKPALMTSVMQRLRTWGTVLALDHIPKPMPGVNVSQYRPFGSQFKYAVARSVVQMVAAESGQGLVLRPTKANFAAKGSPRGVRVTFAGASVTFAPASLGATELAGVETQLPAIERVARALAQYPEGVLPDALAPICEMNEKTVRNYLTSLHQQGRADKLGDGRWRAIPNS